MTPTPDTPDLAELERKLAAATPGPWYTLDPPWISSHQETSILAGSPDPHVATFICDFEWIMLDDEDRKSADPDADAALIVALRNEAPHLIATIRRLEAERDETRGYAAVEADVRKEWREDRSVSPGRVLREMAVNASINSAPWLSDLCNEVCADANRDNHKFVQHRNALRALLYALHARPLFGGPHLSVEDAIAEANAVLDKYQPGAGA